MEQDKIIYDWLSFTVKTDDPFFIVSLIGLSGVPWETVKGAHGYRNRFFYDSISIHFDGRPDMGVWCELSGQGCRAFETLSTLQGDKWQTLFSQLSELDCNITRLDVAYDDHSGLLDMTEISMDTQRMDFVSRSNYAESIWSTKGLSVQIGSPSSPVLIRIYDKARERNCEPGTHWVRVELQLRDKRASAFLSQGLPIGVSFAGVVSNYLRFVEPIGTDSNRWRWPMKSYWEKLLGNAEKISLYEAPGLDYNLDRLDRIVFSQYGNAIDAALQIYGTDSFLKHITERHVRRNPKYTQLVDSIKSSFVEDHEKS